MKRHILFLLILALVDLAGPPLALAVSKETAYMMQQLDNLQQTVQNMQRNLDAQASDFRNFVTQTNKNLESMKATVTGLQKATEQSLATSGARFDSATSQIQAFTESLEEIKTRLSKLSEQVVQTQNIIQTLNTPAPKPAGAGGPPNVPDADALYNSALSYYNGGQYQLAMQSFQDYLRYYGNTDRASNAQFYIGEVYYSQGDYAQAIEEYNKVLERYSESNKQPAAQLKKGYAFLKLKQNQAGVRELRSLAQRFPNSHEAELARQRLRELGVSVPARRGA